MNDYEMNYDNYRMELENDSQDHHYQQQLLQQQQEENLMAEAYVQKDGTVSLFMNDKEGNDKRPDWTGNMVTPKGEKLKISLWATESQKGTNYLSGKVDVPYNSGGGDYVPGSDTTDTPFD